MEKWTEYLDSGLSSVKNARAKMFKLYVRWYGQTKNREVGEKRKGKEERKERREVRDRREKGK